MLELEKLEEFFSELTITPTIDISIKNPRMPPPPKPKNYGWKQGRTTKETARVALMLLTRLLGPAKSTTSLVDLCGFTREGRPRVHS